MIFISSTMIKFKDNNDNFFRKNGYDYFSEDHQMNMNEMQDMIKNISALLKEEDHQMNMNEIQDMLKNISTLERTTE